MEHMKSNLIFHSTPFIKIGMLSLSHTSTVKVGLIEIHVISHKIKSDFANTADFKDQISFICTVTNTVRKGRHFNMLNRVSI